MLRNAVEHEPARNGPLAARERERGAGRQRRDELLAQPRVHEPEDLVVVEGDDDWRGQRGEVARERLDVAEARGLQEAALGGLDRPAVELDDARPDVPRTLPERAQQRRLADARDPVQAGNGEPRPRRGRIRPSA